MKKIFHSILLFASACIITSSCSNGEYQANPAGAANDGVNPLKPLTADEFTWSGSGSFSAEINGVAFKADTSSWYLDSSGTNVFAGYSGKKTLLFYLNGVYAVNVYSLAYHIYNTQALYIENNTGTKNPDTIAMNTYASYLGNSGGVKIVENDSAFIKGLFYFQGVTTGGKLVTVKNGYFNVSKPH